MSGTSADGVDAVLLELPGWPPAGTRRAPPELEGPAPRGRVLEHRFTPFEDTLREAVLAAQRDEASTAELTQLHYWLGEVLAGAAAELAESADLVASHGQTVYHIPRADEGRSWHTRSTLQLGEAALIAERVGRPVIADFRPPDLAAGGQAAPLVPFADRVLFAEAGVRRAVHNLGGISNLSYLPGLSASGVVAFDTGPANALIDEAAGLLRRRFDEGGRLAAGGRVAAGLLDAWRQDPYLEMAPPKSTGREHWSLSRLPGVFELEPRDIVSSVTAFSAATVVSAYRRFVLPLGLDEVVVAGGGAHNGVFMGLLREGLAPVPVLTFEEKGWPGWGSSVREAAAFAVLGYYALAGWPNTLPHTTGARRAVVAGKLSLPPA